MEQRIFKCRICERLVRDNTGGFYVSREDLTVCRKCREEAEPLLPEETNHCSQIIEKIEGMKVSSIHYGEDDFDESMARNHNRICDDIIQEIKKM